MIHTILCGEECRIQPSTIYAKQKTCSKGEGLRFSLRLPLLLCAAIILLAFPSVAADGVRGGLSLCARAVIPALFPFTVLSPLLANALHSCFPGVRARGSILLSFLLGMLTGFPIGALSVISAYQERRISKETAEAWMGLCCGTGPAFLVGYVGIELYENATFGWVLVILQCAATLLTALLCHPPITSPKSVPSTAAENGTQASLVAEIGNAATKLLSICGMIVFFSVLRAFLALFFEWGALPYSVALFLGGALEMTGGIADAALAKGALAPILTAFFVGFGGLCVLGQIGLFAKKAGLCMRWCFLQKLICGILCMGMMISIT